MRPVAGLRPRRGVQTDADPPPPHVHTAECIHHAQVARRHLLPRDSVPPGLAAAIAGQPLLSSSSVPPRDADAFTASAAASAAALGSVPELRWQADGEAGGGAHACATGPNLAWFRQYGRERRVKKEVCASSGPLGGNSPGGAAGPAASGEGGGRRGGRGEGARGACARTLELRGTDDARKVSTCAQKPSAPHREV